MKLNFLVSTVVLLVVLLPRYECRPFESQSAVQQDSGPKADPQQQLQPSLPVLVRLGEEYFIRLGSANSPIATPNMPQEASPANRALQLQLTQRLLQGKVDNISRFVSSYDSTEKGKRSEEPPISLDLTFHLLREVLEMARAEQLAQQVHSNRKMMEIFGK